MTRYRATRLNMLLRSSFACSFMSLGRWHHPGPEAKRARGVPVAAKKRPRLISCSVFVEAATVRFVHIFGKRHERHKGPNGHQIDALAGPVGVFLMEQSTYPQGKKRVVLSGSHPGSPLEPWRLGTYWSPEPSPPTRSPRAQMARPDPVPQISPKSNGVGTRMLLINKADDEGECGT